MRNAPSLLLLCLLFLVLPSAAHAENLPATWDKGFNFSSWLPSEYGSAAASTSLDGLASTGANAITIMPTWYQPALNSNVMAPDAQRTPTDAAMKTAVGRAKAKGLKVTIRPIVDSAGGWRGAFAPTSLSTWFTNYQKMINRYADFARTNKADALSIGVEFRSLTVPANDVRWRTIIKGIRARFTGQLIYAANFDEYQQIKWWDAVDVIGIDAYFPLSDGVTPTEDEIAQRWETFTDSAGVTHHYADEIGAVAARFSRPVMLAELGYPSAPNNLVTPWAIGSTYSATEQQRAYVGAFKAFQAKSWFRGLYIWDWYANPTWGAAGYADHSPQGKPARQTVTEWY